MPRPEKVQAVAEIKERLEGAQAVFLAEYAGLSVKEQQSLRRELRGNDAEFKVVKMSLARRAASELELDELDDLFLGPTGVAYADGDPVIAAKTLRDFAKGHEVFTIKGGLLGRVYLSPERIAELAEVEPRDVLLARLAGALKAPLANMAGLLAALPRNAATAMQQLLERKQQESPAAADAVSEPEAEAADPEPEAEAAEVAQEAEAADPEPEPDAAEVAPESEAAAAPEPEPAAQAEADPLPTESTIDTESSTEAVDEESEGPEDHDDTADAADEE